MKWCVGPLGLLVVILTSAVQGIFIVGPKRIYPGRVYTMIITNFFDRPVDLSLTLKSTDDEYEMPTKNVDVRSNTNKLVDFNIPEDLDDDKNYTLSIIGTRGFSFYEKVELVYETQTMHGLIQLDKPVYRPGEMVNFRVIVLDSELKPPKNLPFVNVNINTPKNIVVELWDEAPLKIGVFEGSFPIAPAPALGTYQIAVEADGAELVNKTFEVKEYVLSGLNVDVFPTRVPLEEHQQVDLTVSAKNVFGKPISGTIHLALYDRSTLTNVKADREFHGMVKLTMPFKRNVYAIEDVIKMDLNWTFIEQYTNRTVSKSVPINIFKNMYRAELVKETPLFFPGYPFRATIKLSYQNDEPATNVTCIVDLEGTKEEELQMVSNEDGKILLKLTPLDDQDNIKVTIMVGDQELLEEEIQKAESSNKEFIKISLKSEVHINMPIKLKVKCRKEVKFFMYYVLAKGNVIDEGYIRVKRKGSFNIDIKYSANMVPKAKVFVATVFGDSVLFDLMDIVFRDLSNDFDMEIETEEVKPGSEIQLEMKGPAQSYVALAAYDKSLLQHGSTHDVYWRDIDELFDKFYGFEVNEFDIFQSIGLFSRASANFKLSQASSTVARNGPVQLVEYRTNFAESFLWINETMGSSGFLRVIEPVPDSTTAWCVTGLSMHKDYGIGIVKKPVQFTTVKAFYIVDHLPYSIKQDEIIVLQFTIFSYLGGDFVTKVTLFNAQDQFEFMESNSENYKTITVQQSVGTRVSFLVKAKKLGEVAVRVKASNYLESDAIEKVIRVMPKSIMYADQESRIFCNKSYVNVPFNMSTNIPKKADNGSIKIYFTLEPNLLAGVIENIGNLITVPTGSGEANMMNFVPNVAVLDYLSAIDPNHHLITKTRGFLQLGYQNQLKYRQQDGSFTDFVGSNSSIFLTAFVAKCMQTAHKYIPDVNSKMVNEAFNWLASKQHNSGKFEEVERIVLQDFQNNERKSIALTSYVLIAFLENPTANTTHAMVIEKAIKYILQHVKDITDKLDLAMVTYALSLHDSKAEVLTSLKERLIQMAYYNETTKDMHWPRETHSIETTSFALLAMLKDDNIIHNGITIMRWLVNQRFGTGVFPRAQDTFLGLKALAALAQAISPAGNDYKVDFKMENNKIAKTFFISKEDTKLLKYEKIPNNKKLFHFNFAGTGFALLTLHYEYSLDLVNHQNQFNLNVNKPIDSNYELRLEICTSFKAKLQNTLSNMALVEVNFPSGYVVDKDPISEITKYNPIKNIEIRYGATSVVVYYANMGKEENCFFVTAYRRFMVSFKRPAYVVVQDYYNPERVAVQKYTVVQDESQI